MTSHSLRLFRNATRSFQARALKQPLPIPYTMKTAFDLSDAEPVQDYEKAITDLGMNIGKNNALYDHYQNNEYYVDNVSGFQFNRYFSGMYGAYWTSHFGGGHLKFLRRRHTEPGIYNSKYPWVNYRRRKMDERGWDIDFPRGQDYHVISKWMIETFLLLLVFRLYLNTKKHFAFHKPPPAADSYPARFNVPFYVYITHEIPSPNFEE